METAAEVVLIVEKENQLTPLEEAIRSRLTDALGYCVSVQGPQCDLTQNKAAGFVVACARHVSGEMRDLALPVLVCNVAALFDLGMTMGKIKVDFGTLPYSSVFIGPEAIGEPLPGAIMGRRQVTDEQAPQGWARPGPNALVVATVGGDSTKAVAFAYDKGDAMPGLDAAHRRGAFLATGDANGHLRAEGWRLFDVVAKGVAEGGKWAESPGPAGLWFLKDGSPTRSLSAGEYRDWVHEQVEKKIWARHLRILSYTGFGSALGVAGLLLAVWNWASSYSEKTAQANKEHIAKQLDDKIKDMKTKELDPAVGGLVKEKTNLMMAELLVDDRNGMGKAVRDKILDLAQTRVKEMIETDPKTKLLMVEAMLSAFRDHDKTADDLLAQYRAIRPTKSPKKRNLTLQLAIVYANKKHEAELRRIVKEALTDEDEAVRVTSLENYEQPGGDEEAKQDLKHVLDAFDFRRSSQAVRDAYATFIARFNDKHADTLIDWLRERDRPFSSTFNAFLFSIARLPKIKEDDERVFNRIVDLAVDPDYNKSTWGVTALGLLTGQDFKLNIDPTEKRKAIGKLLQETKKRAETGRPFIVNLNHASPILTGLLGPDLDQMYILDIISSDKRAMSVPVQVFLFNWVARLEKENDKKLPDAVVNQLLEVTDITRGYGTARLMEHGLRYGDARFARKFLEKSPKMEIEVSLTEDPTRANDDKARANSVFRAAIEGDARSTPPFDATTRLLKLLADEDSVDKEQAKKIKDHVRLALVQYGDALNRQVGDLQSLRTVVGAAVGDNEKDIAEFFSQSLNKAYVRIIAQAQDTGKIETALKVYGDVIQHDRANAARWQFDRGKLYLDKLHLYSQAASDFSAAIELDGKDYRYYQARGEAYRRIEGKLDEAIVDFKRALELCVPKDDKDIALRNARGIILKKRSLAYIIKGEKESARDDVDAAVEVFTSLQQKALAKENLGLLYLKMGEWDLALKNTEDAGKLYSNTPWNWICKYIAAKERADEGRKDDSTAKDARLKWSQLRVPKDLENLNVYVPELLKKHLGVVQVTDDRLQGDPSMQTKFGKSVVKGYPLAVEKGKTYIIDMESTAVDSFLFVRRPSDPADIFFKEDDDNGGGRNARIEFRAEETAKYQIIATSFGGISQGAFALIIRERPNGAK